MSAEELLAETISDVEARAYLPKWLLSDLREIQEAMQTEPVGDPLTAHPAFDAVLKSFSGDGHNNLTYKEAVVGHSFFSLLPLYARWTTETTEATMRADLARLRRVADLAGEALAR